MKTLIIFIFSIASLVPYYAQQSLVLAYTGGIRQPGSHPKTNMDVTGITTTDQESFSFRENSVKLDTSVRSDSVRSNAANLILKVKKKGHIDNLKTNMLNKNSKIKVTFNVYMAYVQNLNPTIDSVFISGTFPGAVWNKPGTNHALRMSDIDSNKVYSITINFDSAQEVQYKFFINAGWGGGEWQGGDNRVVNIYKDTTFNNIFGDSHNDFFIRYPNSSDAWLLQATGFSNQYRGIADMYIVNPQVVWANAFDGLDPSTCIQVFTKTTDGGKTWIPGKYTGVPANSTISMIDAISSQKAWIAVYKKSNQLGVNGIFVTYDGGKSWSQQTSAAFSNSKSFPDIVYFWNAQKGVCIGDPINNYFEIYTTNNGGINWIQVPSENIPVSLSGEYGYIHLYSVYGNTIWFGTNKGRVFKSTDQGYHWTVASTGMTEISNLGFHNDSIGIATYRLYGHSGGIIAFQMTKSVDGGATWSTVNPSGVYYKSDLAVVPDAPGMLISTGISQDILDNGSAYSLDDGNTWTQLDDSIKYTSVKFYSSSVGWAGGFNENSSSRGIWKWQGIPATGVTKFPVEPLSVKIYPNPSSGIVHFRIPVNEQVTEVSIYNLRGKLIGRYRKIGKDNTLDMSNMAGGGYVVIVKTKKGVSKLKLVLQ